LGATATLIDVDKVRSGGLPVTKKRPGGTPENKQVSFRLPTSLVDRAETTAGKLGLDLSNFFRMMLVENIGTYEERVRQIEKRQSHEQG